MTQATAWPSGLPSRRGRGAGSAGLVEGVENQMGAYRAADSPAQDPAGVDIGEEGNIAEPGQGPHVADVTHG